MMKSTIILAGLLVTAQAMADSPVTRVTDSPSFDSIQDAAQAGLAIANDKAGNGNEFCGAIVESHGNYFYTSPVTNDERSSCYFGVAIYAGQHLAGMYHVHPKTALESVAGNRGDQKSLNDQSLFFSPEDIKTAQNAGVPSFIYFQVSGQTRVFVPGKTRTANQPHADGRMGFNKVSLGDGV